MIQAAPVAAASTGYPQITLKFRYDYLGRRVQKAVYDVTTLTSPVHLSGRRYLYDGWNLIADYIDSGGVPWSGSPGALARSYVWGLDIARSLVDAGGVGALLQTNDHASGKSYFPTYDGNGNVISLLNAETGVVAAAYEYSPFGEQIRTQSADPAMADQPFRFSTKYTDGETGLVYYGRRYYNPSQGRFVGRDPIEEQGGLNLYGFCGNNGVNRWDVLGMLAGYDLITGTDGTFTVRIYNETDAGRDYSGERYFTSLDAANSWGTRATANAQIDLSVFSSGPGFDTGFEDFEQMGAAAQQTLQTQALSDINRELAAGNSVAVTVGGQTFILTPGGGAISGGALGGVIIGQIVNLDVVDTAPSGTSSTVQRLSAEESAEQERLRVARSQGGVNKDWAAVVNAGRNTFGNAVFQRPLTTLATAGLQATAMVGAGYAAVAAAPGLAPAGVAVYNAAVYNPVTVRTVVFIAGLATGTSSSDPNLGLKSQQLFKAMTNGTITAVGLRPDQAAKMIVRAPLPVPIIPPTP